MSLGHFSSNSQPYPTVKASARYRLLYRAEVDFGGIKKINFWMREYRTCTKLTRDVTTLNEKVKCAHKDICSHNIHHQYTRCVVDVVGAYTIIEKKTRQWSSLKRHADSSSGRQQILLRAASTT